MVNFRQKEFTEYDAMKSLYVEMQKEAHGDRRRMPQTINPSAVLPILKGNNIVIERFVISSALFGKDKYRMYIKLGAKVKLPENFRLPAHYYPQRVGNGNISFRSGNLLRKAFSATQKEFGDNKGGGPSITADFYPDVRLERSVKNLDGEVVKYDKVERLVILEFDEIWQAIKCLEVLPLGFNYGIYLLDA